MTRKIYTFVLCYLFVFVYAQTNECENLSSDFVTYSELKNCLEAQPYNETIKDLTIISLNSIIDSYVFVDISKNSPNPNIPLQVDIKSMLEDISKTTYKSDAELQQAFASAFAQFQDAHTRYTKPVIPYVHASFVLPFTIESSFDNSNQTLKLNFDSNLLSTYNSIYGTTLSTEYNGYTILSIDEEDALTNILAFANTSVGYTKDISSRFNLAVNGYGSDFPAMYTTRNQSLQGIPSSGVVNLILLDPNDSSQINFSVNWIGHYIRNFSSTLYSQLRRESKVGVHELQFLKNYKRLLPGGISKTHQFQRDVPSALLQEEVEDDIDKNDVYYTILSDKETAVLRISTFGPSNTSVFINTVENAFLYFKTNNAKRLILDLSQNGGGSICLGYALSRYLFPDQQPYVGCYDLKASSLFQLFSTSGSNIMQSNLTSLQMCGTSPDVVGFFTPCAWFDWESGDMFTDNTWISPGVPYDRGGVTSAYSKRLTEGCDLAFGHWLPTEKRQFSPQNIILISDGLCGSTCAVFSRHIQLNHLAKTVVTGGVINAQQPSFTSFPGGQVVHLDYIEDLAERYQVQDSILIPPPLPTTADFRFAIRELYGWEELSASSLPQEFVYLPADFHIPYTTNNYLDHKTIWQQTLPYFDICAPWESKPCPINNGTGAYPCVGGSFDTSECQVISCFPGYERKNGECVPCASGFYKSGFDAGECAPCFPIPTNCKYILQVNTSPLCDYACSTCDTPPPPAPSDSNDSGINLPIWFIVLISIVCFVVGIVGGLVIAVILTKSYLQRKVHFYSHISDREN